MIAAAARVTPLGLCLALALTLAVAVPAEARIVFGTFPPAITTDTSATFTFTGGTGEGFVCQLDALPVEENCTSPRSYSRLALGLHRFLVISPRGPRAGEQRTAYFWQIVPEPPPPVTVAPPAPAPVASPGPPPLLAPFPVVRIVGSVGRRGALIRLLSVRAPAGASVELRCRGRRCPVRRQRITATGALVRFRFLEGRRLPVGTRLEVRVTAADRIGKFTRFSIRARRPPRRTDACLVPGRSGPAPCPPS